MDVIYKVCLCCKFGTGHIQRMNKMCLNKMFDLSVKRQVMLTSKSGTELIKLFSCSTQLSMEFQMIIKSKMLKNKDFSCFQMPRCCIYHAHKCKNVNNCWHFNIYEHVGILTFMSMINV